MASITQKEYARRRGVSATYINRLVHQGTITLSHDGKIDPAKADASWHRSKNSGSKSRKPRASSHKVKSPSSGRPPRGSASRSLTEGRAQKAYYDALLSKLQYEQEAKQLVPRGEVLEGERKKNANIRTRLRRLARSLAPMMSRTISPSECEALMLSEIDALLLELAGDPLGLKPDAIHEEPIPEDENIATEDLQTSASEPAAEAQP